MTDWTAALVHARAEGRDNRTASGTVQTPTSHAPLRAALQALPIRRLHARHELLGDLQCDPFMGNLWRGQLGAWWHRHAPDTFEALMGEEGDGGRPWAIHAPWSDGDWVPAGAVLESRITLIGAALAHEQAVIDALAALGTPGLGRRGGDGARAPARLLAIEAEAGPDDRPDTAPTAWDVMTHAAEAAVTSPDVVAHDAPLSVVLRSPLRVKAYGEIFLGQPTMELLLRRILGRLVLLLPGAPRRSRADRPGTADDEPHAGDAPTRLFDPSEHRQWIHAAAQARCVDHDLQAWHWRRHSRRTGQDMPIEGVTGHLLYSGDRAALLPWLALGEWLQVGTKTSFGFGVIEAR